jgi:hypothetical protein
MHRRTRPQNASARRRGAPRKTKLIKIPESPDNVCSVYSKKRVDLVLRLLEAEHGEPNVVPEVLIEGSPRALEFLGKLLIAQARFTDCGSFISPTGPGNFFFSRKSKLGIYIHRLPCNEQGKSALSRRR